MDASIDQPQIGSITVDRAVLAEPGTDLATALGALGFEVPIDGVPDDAPRSGWRVLARPAYAVVLGTPVDAASTSWRIAQVAPPRGGRGGRLQVHPDPQPLRASRAERSRGLVLRWPEVTRAEPDFDQLAVDVVNSGDERWRPDGDSFRAIGFITRPGDRLGTGSFAFVGGGPSAFALDPGDYARVAVHLDANQWKDLEPGIHEISATLVDLGARTETPLEVNLTAALIEGHQPPIGRPQPPAPDRRRAMEERLAALRALVDAKGHLGAVLETVTTAASEADALLGIGELLDCPKDAARLVYDTSLRRFGSESIDRVAEEAEELERAIEHMTADHG